MMVVCLRLFYARRHPTICCSLVRHRAEIWERDQKPRQRRHFPHFATVTVLVFAEWLGVTVRFADFTEASAKHRFRVAQERDESICEMFAAKFSECVAGQTKLVRQLRLALGALSPMAARQEVFRNF